jgi:transposase-like protein
VSEVKKKRKYRKYSLEFKVETVRRMLAGENVLALSRILDVQRRRMYEWLDRYREQSAERLRGPGRPTFQESVQIMATPAEAAARRIAELERKVGQQSLEVDFLRKAFKRVKESRQPSTGTGGTASTERSGQ